ncbi:MAG: hypothetical protein ACXVCY_07635 [Pseudobdellovibrionaceae bacterium]
MKKVFLLSLTVLLAGCSMEASIENIAQTLPNPLKNLIQKAAVTGLISGSVQTGTASGDGGDSYDVQTSVGGYASGIEQTTDDNSYNVHSSVQGGLITN